MLLILWGTKTHFVFFNNSRNWLSWVKKQWSFCSFLYQILILMLGGLQRLDYTNMFNQCKIQGTSIFASNLSLFCEVYYIVDKFIAREES